jgi:hypothetical protein
LDEQVVTEVYNVRDVLAIIPRLHATLDAGSLAPAPRTYEGQANQLIALIRSTIAPGSWRSEGELPVGIEEYGGQLVITQTAAAHAAIANLLHRLRQQQKLEHAPAGRARRGQALPLALRPIKETLAEQGISDITLLAPIQIRTQAYQDFGFTGWADHASGPIEMMIKGEARRPGGGDTVEMGVTAELIKQWEPSRGKARFERVFGMETTISSRLGDFVVLATSPSATEPGRVIILVVRVTAGK